MNRFTFALLACASLVAALAGGAMAQPPARLNPDTATVVHDGNAFALDLYRDLAAKDGNLFFSPYSISTALAMTYAGARGQTADQMAKALHFTLDGKRLHPAYADLIRTLNGDGKPRKYQLQVANRLWGQKDYGFLPDFLTLTEASYGAGLKEVDFIGATEKARKAINAWVEEQTKDKIKELLKPGILTVDTRLVLTNAIYFKAAWLRPFSEKATKEGDFTLASGAKVRVPLMQSSNRTNYAKTDTFEALELRYEQHDLSMLVFLPKKADGLAAFEKTLTPENLTQWRKKMHAHIVETTLPKFKITAEFMLKDVLSRLGMSIAFAPGKADFSGMTTREKLYISAVVHKAFVDVNEKGTEAAASTAVVMEAASEPPPATFRADRPFVFVLRDNRTGSILFIGRAADPR